MENKDCTHFDIPTGKICPQCGKIIVRNHLGRAQGHHGTDYIDKNGEIQTAVYNLTPERDAELRTHIQNCGVALADCPECWELYSNIGHDVYVEVIMAGM